MLKRRLVPKLLLKSRKLGERDMLVLVTTRRYDQVFEIGDPISQAKIYEAQFADELILLNIDSAPIAAGCPLLEALGRAASETFMPLAVGGGVRTVLDFERLLEGGADKVCINSAAVSDPSLIDRAAAVYGAQCVVLAIDYRRDGDGVPRVHVDGGRRVTTLDPATWAREVAARGAGELLLTDVERDGTGAGLDIDVLAEVAAAVDIPVIASGGCGLAQHFVDGFAAGAEAVAAGTFFALRDQNPMQARAHVRNAGVPIRMST